MISQKLIEVVDIFRCCLFTLGALTTVLPAFLIAGAIGAFASTAAITRFLGPKTNKWISLPIASVIGQILPTCSCNIVPLFASILRRGGGIGPAFTFLYAGPAVSIISIAFVFKMIGPLIAFWRIVGVITVSIAIGIIMPLIFKDTDRNAPPGNKPDGQKPDNTDCALDYGKTVKKPALIFFFIMLFSILAIGSTIGGIGTLDKDNFIPHKIALMTLLSAGLTFLLLRNFPKESRNAWAREVWWLLKTILPVLIPSILVIGLISAFVDIKWVHSLFSAQKDALGNRLFLPNLQSTFLATLFGEIMYFPILTEVVFVKAFLKMGMDIGPALGILLAGPGTSLPGLLLIYKFTGFKKVLAYFTISLVMETLFAFFLSMNIGDYLCACMIAK